MATCNCHGQQERATARVRVGAEQTVGEVAGRSAEALEVLRGFGINHCCGAGLTLAEAAASAGVDLRTLLAALGELGSARRRG